MQLGPSIRILGIDQATKTSKSDDDGLNVCDRSCQTSFHSPVKRSIQLTQKLGLSRVEKASDAVVS